jgi:hypothetical protein
MKKSLLIILIVCMVPVAQFAQVPGYMGKRLILGVENSISPNFPVLLYLDSPTSYYLGPVISSTFRIDYVLSNRKAISLTVRYSPRKFEERYYYNQAYKTDIERLNLITYSVGMKRYSRKNIAPLGFFTKWEASFIKGWINYKSWTSMEEHGNQYVTIEQPAGSLSVWGLGGGYGIGAQRVFMDKFAVEYGVRANLNLVFYPNASAHEKQLANEATEPFQFPVFNAYIGIGFLTL